jgi:hypothetical protein
VAPRTRVINALKSKFGKQPAQPATTKLPVDEVKSLHEALHCDYKMLAVGGQAHKPTWHAMEKIAALRDLCAHVLRRTAPENGVKEPERSQHDFAAQMASPAVRSFGER